MSVTRRELFSMLPVVLIPRDSSARGFQSARKIRCLRQTYPFEKFVGSDPRTTRKIRDVPKGQSSPPAESLEVHETTLPPGGAPHPPHHHVHSEMWLIREGTVELTINGTSYRLGPGSVGFVHSNDEHGIKNVGTTPANLFLSWLSAQARVSKKSGEILVSLAAVAHGTCLVDRIRGRCPGDQTRAPRLKRQIFESPLHEKP